MDRCYNLNLRNLNTYLPVVRMLESPVVMERAGARVAEACSVECILLKVSM